MHQAARVPYLSSDAEEPTTDLQTVVGELLDGLGLTLPPPVIAPPATVGAQAPPTVAALDDHQLATKPPPSGA